uniref:Uncharacterized protein n=1 Tax=Aegilops tauschii subsp. strangulata TaxID=200361 RepID=A0A453FWN5_AEGTS
VHQSKPATNLRDLPLRRHSIPSRAAPHGHAHRPPPQPDARKYRVSDGRARFPSLPTDGDGPLTPKPLLNSNAPEQQGEKEGRKEVHRPPPRRARPPSPSPPLFEQSQHSSASAFFRSPSPLPRRRPPISSDPIGRAPRVLWAGKAPSDHSPETERSAAACAAAGFRCSTTRTAAWG